MSSNFDKTERHVTQSLKQHPESMKGVMHELHNLQHHESAAAFKQDLNKLNDHLHKQGLLPGLQITEHAKTHKLELKPDGSSSPSSPEQSGAPEQPQSHGRPKQSHGGNGGGGGGDSHHHGGKHKHGRHHRHHGKGGQDGQDPDQDNPDEDKAPGADSQPDSKDPKGKDQTPGGDTKPGSDDTKKDGQNLSKEDKEKYLMKRLTDNHEGGLHLTKAQAAGVIGNLEHESHLNQNYSHHTNGDGREEHNLGIAQWVGKRKHDLERYAGKDATDFYKQVDFMEHELKGSEKGALNALRRTNDASHAALAFSRLYERPGAPHNSERVKNAQIAFNKYKSYDADV